MESKPREPGPSTSPEDPRRRVDGGQCCGALLLLGSLGGRVHEQAQVGAASDEAVDEVRPDEGGAEGNEGAAKGTWGQSHGLVAAGRRLAGMASMRLRCVHEATCRTAHGIGKGRSSRCRSSGGPGAGALVIPWEFR